MIRATWIVVPLVLLAPACSPLNEELDCACTGTPAMNRPERALVAAVNAYREQHGLAAVRPSAALFAAEHRIGIDSCTQGKASHTGSDGSSMFSRARDAGYACGTCYDGTCAFEIGYAPADTCDVAAHALDWWENNVCRNAVILNQDVSELDACHNADWRKTSWVAVGAAIVGNLVYLSFGECPDAPPDEE
jgi:hypothetical protein